MPELPKRLNNNKYIRKNSYQRGYNSKWQKARKLFLENYPLCQCEECQKLGRLWTATVVHHKIPHKGNQVLFWDKNNWMAMAKKCHDKHTATERMNNE